MKQHNTYGFTIESWEEVRELRRMVELDGVPKDRDDIRAQFVHAVRNAEQLRMMFGGTWDEASRREAFALVEVIKEAVRWDTRPTHISTAARH